MRARSSLVSLVLGLSLAIASGLTACSEQKPTVTTWVYDEVVTLQKTDEIQRASKKKRLEGLRVSLVIQSGQFVMTQVGGKEPGEYRGSSKSDFGGIRLRTTTKDGKPVADPDATEVTLRQPEPKRLEMTLEGTTVSLTRR